MSPAPPKPAGSDWYICCPVYGHAVGSGGNYRCTEVLIVPANSEEEAIQKTLTGTDEEWGAVAVIKATTFTEQAVPK